MLSSVFKTMLGGVEMMLSGNGEIMRRRQNYARRHQKSYVHCCCQNYAWQCCLNYAQPSKLCSAVTKFLSGVFKTMLGGVKMMLGGEGEIMRRHQNYSRPQPKKYAHCCQNYAWQHLLNYAQRGRQNYAVASTLCLAASKKLWRLQYY